MKTETLITTFHQKALNIILLLCILLIGIPSSRSQNQRMYLEFSELNLIVHDTHTFDLYQIGELNQTVTLNGQVQHSDIIHLVPTSIDIPASDRPNASALLTHTFNAYAQKPGHSVVAFNVTPDGFVNVDSLFFRVTVMYSNVLYVISDVIGWVYFLAWSISFYPQIYTNFKRKSVVGLNFDFISLNIMGFTLYSVFNCGLYYSQTIESQYLTRYPRSVNPVQLNDVFFSLHAAFATIITIGQCLIYEREEQRVSTTGRSILGVFVLVVIVTAGLAAGNVVQWLDFLYYCSYIKLCITLIKYVPQAYMNYKRKSTVGWSIGNIFLDFTGGFFSILQMLLNAYNYHDWISIFGDVTKFGLGMFSLIFDVFFILQHYVFYRITNYEPLDGAVVSVAPESSHQAVTLQEENAEQTESGDPT